MTAARITLTALAVAALIAGQTAVVLRLTSGT